jgi:hypothetical protein
MILATASRYPSILNLRRKRASDFRKNIVYTPPVRPSEFKMQMDIELLESTDVGGKYRVSRELGKELYQCMCLWNPSGADTGPSGASDGSRQNLRSYCSLCNNIELLYLKKNVP